MTIETAISALFDKKIVITPFDLATLISHKTIEI